MFEAYAIMSEPYNKDTDKLIPIEIVAMDKTNATLKVVSVNLDEWHSELKIEAGRNIEFEENTLTNATVINGIASLSGDTWETIQITL